jgi:hypothetical protein
MTRNLDKVFTRRESQQKSHISTQHQKRHGSCRRSIFSPASADFGKRRFFVTFRCVMAKTSLDIKSRGVASDVHHMAAEALITSRYLRWSSHSENSFKNKKKRKELFWCAHPGKEKKLYYYIHRRVSVPSAFLTLFVFFFLRRRE